MSSPSPMRTGPGNIPIVALFVVAACIIVTFIVAVTFLASQGKPTQDVFKILSVLLGAVSSLGSTSAVIYAAKSAKRSDDAARSVNGELQGRMKNAAADAIAESGLTPSNVTANNVKAVTP